MSLEFPIKAENVVLYTKHKDIPNVKYKKPLKIIHGDEARLVLREALLPIYVPGYVYNLVKPPEKIYYRVYKKGDEYAVFLLYTWPDQVIPPHRYDYEPMIVILDKNLNIKEIYTDGFHYYIHKQTPPPLSTLKPHIYISTPWRSMEIRWSEPGDRDVMIYPVDEVEGDMAKTKIQYLSDRVIQELRSRTENPLAVNEKLIRNPFSVRYAKHWATYTNPTPADLMRDFAKNYGVSRIDLFVAKIKLFLKSMIDKVKAFIQGVRERVQEMKEEYEEEYALH